MSWLSVNSFYMIVDTLIDGNASKAHISKMHNVQDTIKTVLKQTDN